jgi:hypothetical protein
MFIVSFPCLQTHTVQQIFQQENWLVDCQTRPIGVGKVFYEYDTPDVSTTRPNPPRNDGPFQCFVILITCPHKRTQDLKLPAEVIYRIFIGKA